MKFRLTVLITLLVAASAFMVWNRGYFFGQGNLSILSQASGLGEVNVSQSSPVGVREARESDTVLVFEVTAFEASSLTLPEGSMIKVMFSSPTGSISSTANGVASFLYDGENTIAGTNVEYVSANEAYAEFYIPEDLTVMASETGILNIEVDTSQMLNLSDGSDELKVSIKNGSEVIEGPVMTY